MCRDVRKQHFLDLLLPSPALLSSSCIKYSLPVQTTEHSKTWRHSVTLSHCHSSLNQDIRGYMPFLLLMRPGNSPRSKQCYQVERFKEIKCKEWSRASQFFRWGYNGNLDCVNCEQIYLFGKVIMITYSSHHGKTSDPINILICCSTTYYDYDIQDMSVRSVHNYLLIIIRR